MYTYATLNLGVLGWFSVPSAKAAIIVLVVPLSILFAWKSGKYILFLLASLLSFGLMFFTGTKFTFYSIFIIAGLHLLFVLNFQKKSLALCAAAAGDFGGGGGLPKLCPHAAA